MVLQIARIFVPMLLLSALVGCSTKPGKAEAWVMAQQFVNDNLKAPKTADYGDQSAEDVVTETGDEQYRISAWVDSQNAFGAMIRTHFVCEIKHVGSDRWELVSLKSSK